MDISETKTGEIVATGVAGLDNILRGGVTSGRLYLLEGQPGSGKTTLSLQFLLEGVRRKEPALYVTLSETKKELLAVAQSHGWSLDGIQIHEMTTSEATLSPDAQLTMFHPGELELNETTKAVLADVDKYRPKRVVFDSLSEMRLLAQNPLRFRRQILGLKQFFSGRDSTVFLLDDRTGPVEDSQLRSIAHGVICLEVLTTGYGAERRKLSVAKMRGIEFRGGYHDFSIRRGGLEVYPRLVAAEHHGTFSESDIPSGNAEFDKLLVGGLPSGTSTLFIGPAGIGKSTLGIQFVVAAARRGQRGAIFAFDETEGILRSRSRKLGLKLDELIADKMVTLRQVDPAELSPGEFITAVRHAVEGTDEAGRPAKMVMIDSLNGYLHSMPDDKYLNAQLHELFTYLNNRGVNTLVMVTQSGMLGSNARSPIDTTYLADNVILFRYFEAGGMVRRAVSVVKKRSGAHEHSIREMHITNGVGIEVGPPLQEFHGLLTGTPTFVGNPEALIKPNHGKKL